MLQLNQIQVSPKSGLRETIIQMNLIERKAFQNQKFVTWSHKYFYSDCESCLPGKVWRYMREYFLYERDDPHDELIIAPYLMPDLRRGDCDDFSLFAKSVIDIIGGWHTSYIVFAKEKGSYTHIAVFAHRGTPNDQIDPVIIDGVNSEFNSIPEKYNYWKLV